MKKSAFTLLEIMIAVIIVGILTTIAVPQYIRSTEKAKAGKAKSNMALIAKAEHMYHQDFSNYHDLDSGDSAEGSSLSDYMELAGVDRDSDWLYYTSTSTSWFTVWAERTTGPCAGDINFLGADGEYIPNANCPSFR